MSRSLILGVCGMLAACGGSDKDAVDASPVDAPVVDGAVGGVDSAVDAAVDAANMAACEVRDVTGTIPGVSLRVWGDSCLFPMPGATGTFHYEATVGPGAPVVHLPALDGCGDHTDDPLSFVSYRIDGNDQLYCLCDVGRCAGEAAHDVTLRQGSFAGSFDWPGRNWTGPSDTGNMPGDPFPRGDYAVRVTFDAFAEGKVEAVLPITVGDTL